jgi:hypothetical protein
MRAFAGLKPLLIRFTRPFFPSLTAPYPRGRLPAAGVKWVIRLQLQIDYSMPASFLGGIKTQLLPFSIYISYWTSQTARSRWWAYLIQVLGFDGFQKYCRRYHDTFVAAKYMAFITEVRLGDVRFVACSGVGSGERPERGARYATIHGVTYPSFVTVSARQIVKTTGSDDIL